MALSSGVQTPTGMAQMKRNRVLLGGKEEEEYRKIEEDRARMGNFASKFVQ